MDNMRYPYTKKDFTPAEKAYIQRIRDTVRQFAKDRHLKEPDFHIT